MYIARIIFHQPIPSQDSLWKLSGLRKAGLPPVCRILSSPSNISDTPKSHSLTISLSADRRILSGFIYCQLGKRIDVHHDEPLRYDVDTLALGRAVESIPLIVREKMAERLWTYRLLHVPPSESHRVGTRARGIMRRHRVQRWLRRGVSTIVS